MSISIEQVLQALTAGLLVGCVYGLMCVGLAFIFGIMRVINFAQGDFMMAGMYLAIFTVVNLSTVTLVGPVVSFVAALATAPVMFVAGYVVHRFLIARVTGMRAVSELEAHQAQLVLTLGVDETFTPPLSDAGPMMQKVRTADIKLTLEKLTEIGLPRSRLPVINNGSPTGSPDLLRIVGKDTLEGAMFITANWGSKAMEDVISDYKKRTGDPWITQDSLSNYGHMLILKEAVERAGATDREKVNAAIRSMDLTDGPALLRRRPREVR
jgi:substrate-binding family protein/branched-subunit amino acid transport system permease